MNNIKRLINFFRNLNRENISKLFLLLSASIFVFTACILLIVSIGFAIKVPMASWQIIVSLLITLLIQYIFTSYYFKENRLKKFINISLFFLLILSICILIGSSFYDLSWDGQTYHQEAIIQLYNGWNPFYSETPNNLYSIWLEHYPKTLEILAASLYKLTGSIEAGKAFNILFIIATFLISLSFFMNFKKINIIVAIVTSLIIAMNPVSIYQSLTYYVDGILASLIASFLIIIILIYIHSDRILLGLLFAILLVLINIKFTALIYSIVFTIGFLILLIIKKYSSIIKKFSIISVLSFSFLFSILFIGFNPYVTNSIKHKNPFYPINKIDIITGNTPVYFLKMNRFESLIYSILAQTDNNLPGDKLKLKIPFTFMNENYWFNCADVRTGGFGPLFSGIILIFLILLLSSIILIIINHEFEILKLFFFIILTILVSVFTIPPTWWARYIPQLWLLPICIIPVIIHLNNRVLKIGSYLLIGVFLVNIYIIASINLKANLHNTQTLKYQLKKIAALDKVVDVYFGDFYSNRIRFEKLGIRFHEFETEKELKYKDKIESIFCSSAKISIP